MPLASFADTVCYNSLMLEILNAPKPILSVKAKKVKKVDKKLLSLIEEMKKTLDATEDPKGVGLAAPQVGVSLRIFIAKPTERSKIMVFINPEILKKSSENDYVQRPDKDVSEKALRKLEGCLSLPTIWGPVLRSSSLTLSYTDENGKENKQEFKGFLSTIVQHEIDHLNGILFPKRVLEQKGILYKSKKDEKGEDVFEELDV
jgi:peptide deformylase